MNKGLEVIEASRFFGLPGEQIAVLVHRTSVAHGLVVFTDGNVKAQLAAPDMRLPIGYALAYPDRLPAPAPEDALVAVGGERGADATTLRFERPDLDRFPCLRLAYEALARGGTAPAALSAANEIAVAAFVNNEIAFGAIPECIAQATDAVQQYELTLDAVREADQSARRAATAAVAERRVKIRGI
jgi:1-deoxy-D-xylulose-5-phosphate reductoisomerase